MIATDGMIGLDLSGVQHRPCWVAGELEFGNLPAPLASAEREQLELDRDAREEFGSGNRRRRATDAERVLLRHLGYGPLPQRLTTLVQWRGGRRRRTWPQLDNDRRDR